MRKGVKNLENTSNLFNVEIWGDENDDDAIEEGLCGKKINMNITSEDLEVPTNEDLEQMLKEAIKIIKNL